MIRLQLSKRPAMTRILATGAICGLWITAGPAAAQISGAEKELRHAIAWQVALDNTGFSPGLIDGKPGAKTKLVTGEFQRVKGLPVTGELNSATAAALKVSPDNILARYTIEQDDLAAVGPAPTGWLAKSKLNRLGYESLEHVIAEKFHCTRGLLATLNPGKAISRMKPGDKVIVPMVEDRGPFRQAAYLQVNLAQKVIRVIGEDQKLVALFHCSIAASKSKLPKRDTQVVNVAPNPTYTFDPDMWKEVKEPITTKLTIPPGPRNPVGLCWIGLGLPGYGIHGTPNPELIGKTGSHGCIRLANWDALRLGKMVREGTPVRFVNDGLALAAER